MSRPISTAAALLVVVATSHVVAQQRGTSAGGVTLPPQTGMSPGKLASSKVSSLTTIHGNALDTASDFQAHRAADARVRREDHFQLGIRQEARRLEEIHTHPPCGNTCSNPAK